MKKLIFLTISSFSLLIWASCGGDNHAFQEEDTLRNEVFAIHDEVMPKMSEIVQLKGGLIEMPTDSTNEAEVKAAHSHLEKAEDAMMQWMNNFTAPEKLRDTKSHEEIMAYLQNEKVAIIKVKDDMNSSIEAAKRILKPADQ